ncbi:MAG: element excision factor XisH family protein [Pyrinomonadaceae bacterium]|jgi:predicted RecB family endonuclease
MPAKDIYHDTVKRALIKDGWKITAENLHLPWGGRDTFVDIAAEKIFIAEKEGRKIAVEVKSFVGKSDISEFEKAVGQFIVYRFAMRKREPERQLFLAVELGIYENFFVNPEVLELIETEDLKVMVFDKLKEVIVRWIN